MLSLVDIFFRFKNRFIYLNAYIQMNVTFCYRKVSLMEDSDQNIHLKNLSVHQASNEEEALNLLFLGDTNRMIAEVHLQRCYSLLLHCFLL